MTPRAPMPTLEHPGPTPNAIQPLLDEVIAGTRPLNLDIRDEDGGVVGSLRPLTRAHLDDPDIIQRLTDWRNQNMGNFLSQFVATPQRTRDWMRNVLFNTPGQMLFLVCVDHRVVGHFGFKELTGDDVLLDNAMRGDRAGHPRLFVFAGKALVQWLLTQADVKRVRGYVMADNVPSIMMNKQIGFGGWHRHPLLKRERDGEILWEMGPEGAPSPDGRDCFKLVIERVPQ